MAKIFRFPPTKGLDTVTDQVTMKADYAPVARNVYADERGLWTKRPGTVAASQAITGSPSVESLVLYRKRDGTEHIIAAAGGSLLLLNSDQTWTTIRTGLGSNKISAATFNDKLVIFNGVNLPFWTDGTTWGELSNICTDWAYGDTPKHVLTFKGRLFAAGRPGARQMVYYSALQDMNDWVSANNAGYIDLSMQASIASGEVTALAVWEGYLVFMMADEVFVWDWNSPQSQGLVKVFPVGAPYGCPVGFGTDLVFASRLGVKSLTRSQKTGELNVGNLSEKVETLILSRMKASGVVASAIAPTLRLVLLNMPPSIMVYDYTRGAWFEWTGITAYSMLHVGYHLYIGGQGKVYRLDQQVVSDDGTAYEMYLETPWLTLGNATLYKKPIWLKLIIGEGALGTLTVSEQVDFSSWSSVDQEFTASSGSYWRSSYWRTALWRGTKSVGVSIPLLGRGRAVKFGFKHTEAKPFSVAAEELIYSESGLRA